jgi:hypothetical protein
LYNENITEFGYISAPNLSQEVIKQELGDKNFLSNDAKKHIFHNLLRNSNPLYLDKIDYNQASATISHYSYNALWHVVTETVFYDEKLHLTEKIFKPIKFGQPFVIAGAPRSLQALRDLGYRTFDHAIDNSYDLELNNTQRWIQLRSAIAQIKHQNMSQWFASCIDDVQHNQQVFLSSKYNRLNSLLERLNK